ncbi:MAG: HNH endonuclease [Gemmatimonadaceae bacterium]
MSIYVYPTDVSWFRFLQARSPLDEVNFWQPGGTQAFTRLQPGELFLFRLKSPINMIAGGGVFVRGLLFPLSEAWEAFGDKNGVASFDQLFAAIDGYRRKQANDTTQADTAIGCIMLQSPFFLHERDWIPVPPDYHSNLVQGKRFSLESDSGRALFQWASQRLRASAVRERALEVPGPTIGDPALVQRRLGQGAFRVLVSDAYDRRCAVTGEKTLPVLEAAHIRPVSRGGEHRLDNGLLLRSDLHKLFDLGYVTVTTGGDFRVSSKLRETWLNGRVYYDLAGASVRPPSSLEARPSRQHLEWHNDVVFRP